MRQLKYTIFSKVIGKWCSYIKGLATLYQRILLIIVMVFLCQDAENFSISCLKRSSQKVCFLSSVIRPNEFEKGCNSHNFGSNISYCIHRIHSISHLILLTISVPDPANPLERYFKHTVFSK